MVRPNRFRLSVSVLLLVAALAGCSTTGLRDAARDALQQALIGTLDTVVERVVERIDVMPDGRQPTTWWEYAAAAAGMAGMGAALNWRQQRDRRKFHGHAPHEP